MKAIWKNWTNYDTFAVDQFSYFLSRLQETKDLTGKSLLNSTMSLSEAACPWAQPR